MLQISIFDLIMSRIRNPYLNVNIYLIIQMYALLPIYEEVPGKTRIIAALYYLQYPPTD